MSSAPSTAGRFDLGSRSLRQVAARGTLVNAGFLTAVSLLGLVRGFVLAYFISASDYGVWGILVVSLGTILWLKQVGIGDKYIQQADVDQELAFQRAFTLEALFTGIFALVLLAVVPVVAIVYGHHEVLLPGLALVLVLPAVVLQAPLWIFYRRMEFVRQRSLQAIDPLVGFVVAVVLAAAGAGYWSFVAGLLAGAWAAALVAVRSCPYPLRLRYDRGTLRSYIEFSWPLFVAGAAGMLIAQASILAGEQHLGLTAVGAMTLAATVSQFGDRLDSIVTGSLYPAICAVRDRTELLYESFVKSNRLALMWAVPFGIGLALFSPELVSLVLGEKWRAAVILLQTYGVVAAANHIGFNWDSYFRARGETRPIAVSAVLTMVVMLGAGLPLLFTHGLGGFALGVGAGALVNLICRAWYLRRMFAGFGFMRHAIRGVAPTIPAAFAVLALRALASPANTSAGWAIAELLLYVVVTATATLGLERPLLREATRYVREGRPAAAG